MVDPSRRFLKIPETQKRFHLITCFYYDKELCYHQVFSKEKITSPGEGGARSNIQRINFGNAGLESISLCFKGDRSGTIHIEIQLWETLCLQLTRQPRGVGGCEQFQLKLCQAVMVLCNDFKSRLKLQFWSDQSLSVCFWRLLKRMIIKNIYHFNILYLNCAQFHLHKHLEKTNCG